MRSSEPVLDVKAIKHAMVEKGFNQTDLAREVGVHQSRISLWLKGTNNPDLPSAKSLADALEVKIDDLLLAK